MVYGLWFRVYTLALSPSSTTAAIASLVDPSQLPIPTKEGPGFQDQNGVDMLMHRAWVTHHHCPLALE